MINKTIGTLMMVVLLLSFGACASIENDGAEYISGSYMNDELDVGYSFYTDGKGYQFILENVYPIEYEIKNGYISINTIVDESDLLAIFTFEKKDDNIIINGITYVVVPDELSVISEEIASK